MIRLLKCAVAGGLLIAFPYAPVSWIFRLWVLGWMAELMADGTFWPSWRHPLKSIARGCKLFAALFPLLLPGSFCLYVGWLAGWIISFERVRDYMAFGPVVTVAGFILLSPCLVLLPMITVEACRSPDGWTVARARQLALARPFRYFFVLAATMVLSTPLQIARQPVLQNPAQFFLVGVLSFLLILACKLLWLQHHAACSARPAWSGWLALPMLALGLFYGFRLIATQFLMWNSHLEWFAHALFLLPGAPASVSRPGIYW